jgi:hypothetical protein
MLRHVQCTYPNLSWLLVVAAACSLAACGGSIGGDSVTGSPVAATPLDLDVDLELAVELVQWGDLFENEDGTITTSGHHHGKALVCHEGRKTLWVSQRALPGHTRHGDARGRCDNPPSAPCPCFSGDDVDAVALSCTSTVTPECGMGDPYSLALICSDAGGSVPPIVLGVYQTASGGSCDRRDLDGTVFTQSGLTDAEYQGCVNVINSSGYCS